MNIYSLMENPTLFFCSVCLFQENIYLVACFKIFYWKVKDQKQAPSSCALKLNVADSLRCLGFLLLSICQTLITSNTLSSYLYMACF